MRGVTVLAWVIIVIAAGPASAQAITWQDAIAELTAERERAQTCVKLILPGADADRKQAAVRSYQEARAEIHGVIEGLRTVILTAGGTPEELASLQARMQRAFDQRLALCRLAPAPEAGGRNLLTDILNAVIGPIGDAIATLYRDHRADEQLRRETIANSLTAARWPEFGEIK